MISEPPKKNRLTIDSSVFVSMFVAKESRSDEARSIIHNAIINNTTVIIPYTILIEVISAINRRTNSKILAQQTLNLLIKLPNFKFIEIDEKLAKYTCEITLRSKLRGLDSIIMSTSLLYNCDVITFDKELESAFHTLTS